MCNSQSNSIVSYYFDQGCLTIYDCAVSVETVIFDANKGSYIMSMSRLQDTVNTGGVDTQRLYSIMFLKVPVMIFLIFMIIVFQVQIVNIQCLL